MDDLRGSAVRLLGAQVASAFGTPGAGPGDPMGHFFIP